MLIHGISARQQLAKILHIHHQGNWQADSGPDTKLALYKLKKNFSSIIRFGKAKSRVKLEECLLIMK